MLMLLRQLLSIAILPFTMTVLIPLSIVRRGAITFPAPHSAVDWLVLSAAIAIGAAGLTLFATTVYLFWTRGRGTLAPWDPPRDFVATGPYRYVRNPMISGVILMLIGEGAAFRSMALLEWAGTFFVINLIYIPLMEEPMLEERFGESYARYKRNVGRFIPRMTPWSA